MKQKKKWLIILGSLFLVLLVCDMRLKTVIYTIESEKINNPVKIALITDLHSNWYGKNQRTLIRAVEKQNPDIVLLGGDIFDDKKTYDNAEKTIQLLTEKYPCYYVTGNHEYWSYDIETIFEILTSYGVTILSGECVKMEVNGEKINLCGVDDPDVMEYTENGIVMEEQLKMAEKMAKKEYYTILLSHRPEWIETYQKYVFDLVLCGHAHGGQWRIPFVLNGLYAPHQGIFPKYAGGRYDYATGTMIVSRGLARESTPVPRIFNRPELVIVKLN